MKKTILTLSIICFTYTVFAQKEMLNKEETVAYLNKKASEIIGHYRTVKVDNGTLAKRYYFNYTVSFIGENLVLNVTRSNYHQNLTNYSDYRPHDYFADYITQAFNPAHIINVEIEKSSVAGEPVGSIKISLKSNTGRRSYALYGSETQNMNQYNAHYGEWTGWKKYQESENSVNVISSNYLQADDTSFDKIKRALEHLRDLCKAEDDPFGN